MSDESVGTTNVTKLSETDLGNDGSKFSGGGRDTVRGRTVTSGECLTGNDEGGCVGTKVLEEVGQTVKEDESLGSRLACNKLIVPETHADEKDGEHDETHELDGLSSPTVDEDEGNPVSRDETSDGKDQVAKGDVPQVVIDFVRSGEGRRSETNGGQDDGRVKSETVESDLRKDERGWFTRVERKGIRRERTRTKKCRTGPFHAAIDRSDGGSQPKRPWGHRACG